MTERSGVEKKHGNYISSLKIKKLLKVKTRELKPHDEVEVMI